MPIATIIVKNQTLLDLPLKGLSVPGEVIPGSGQVDLTSYNKIIDILEDPQLQGYLNAGSALYEVDGLEYTSNQSRFLANVLIREAAIIRVAVAGGDYTSLKEAIEAVVDATAAKPYIIKIAPGVYDEDPFAMKSYVNVMGEGNYYDTTIRTTDDNAHFITGASATAIENIAIKGPTGTGFAAIYHTDTSTQVPLLLTQVAFKGGYYAVWAHSAGPGYSRVQCQFCATYYDGDNIDTAFRATGYSRISGLCSAVVSGPPGFVTHGYYASGPNVELTMDTCSHSISGGTDGVFADDGANVRMNACTFGYGTNAIHIGSTGSATTVVSSGSIIRYGRYTKDIYIESATANLQFTGGSAYDESFDIIAGASLTGSFTCSAGEMGLITIGEVWAGPLSNQLTPLSSYTRATGLTGWLTGGAVTRATGLHVNVALGTGFINTGTIVAPISWVATPNVDLTANTHCYLYVTSTATIAVASVLPDFNTNIILAEIYTSATGVVLLASQYTDIAHIKGALHSYTLRVIGSMVVAGLASTKHATPSLKIDVDGGQFYQGDALKTTTGSAPITFTYWYRKLGGGWNFVTGQTDVDTGFYDDGSGTLAALPGTKYKKDALWVSRGGDGTEFHLVYAQQYYDSQILAEGGGLPNADNALQMSSCVIAGSVVLSGATDIASVVDERPNLAGGGGSGGTVVTVHGLLSGLNADDHAQYALLSGDATRNPVTGTLNISGGGLILPVTATPAQTIEGQVIWDSDDDRLTVGTGAGRKLLMNQGDSAGGDVGGTYPTSLTVTDLTMSGEAQGDVLYFNGSNWVVLHAGTTGKFLKTQGAAANPLWDTPPDATKTVSGYMPFVDKHWANHSFDSGWAQGGELTYGALLVINVAAGEGFINDATDDTVGTTFVSWAATTVSATANSTGWVYVTSAGVVSYSTTEPSITNTVILGTVQANATVLTMISNARPANLQQFNGNYGEFIEQAFGGLAVSGLVATQNATPLHLDVTAGVYFLAGRIRSATSGTNITWTYWYRNGSGGWTTVKTASAIDVTNYDSGTGTLTAIPANRWKKDVVYITENGSGKEYHVQYATDTYNTQASAKAAPVPSPPLALMRYAARFAGPVVQQGAATISVIMDERPVLGQAGVSSSSPVRVASRFIPVLSSSSMQVSVWSRQVVVPVATNGGTNLSFSIPSEAVSIVSAFLIGIPSAGAAGAARDIDFYTDYGTVGESPTTHQQSDTASTYNLTGTTGLLTNIKDLAALLTSAAGGDIVGLYLKHNAIGGQIEYLGINLTYEVAA